MYLLIKPNISTTKFRSGTRTRIFITPNDAHVHVEPVEHLPDDTMDELTDEETGKTQDMGQEEIPVPTEETLLLNQTPQLE